MKTILSAKSFVLGLALLLVISTLGSAFAPVGQAFAAAEAAVPATAPADSAQAASASTLDTAAIAAAPPTTVAEATYNTVKYILNSGVTSDWQAIGVSQAGYKVPESYLQALQSNVQQKGGILSSVTEYARTVLTITALGGDAANVASSGSEAGYNLVEKLYNSDKMSSQTLNSPVYALLALDSGSYTIPDNAAWTRTALVSEILSKQKDDGGFALFGAAGDPDMTAVTLTALAPYQDKPEVKTAGEKAVQWLSTRQDASGGYGNSSESVAQAIIALTSNGIDPTGEPFTKNGTDLVERLMSFAVEGGGFAHTQGGSVNLFSTEQGLQALVAYQLFSGGSGKLYDFTKPVQPELPFAVKVALSIEGPQGTVAEGNLKTLNTLDALKQLAASNNIPLKITEYSFGSLVTGINGIEGGTYGGYWSFVVNRGGEWVYPSLGMDAFPLEESDRVVVYFGGENTRVVDSVTVSSPQPKPGEKFTVAVTQKQWVYNDKTFTSEPVVSPAAGVQVSAGDRSVTTDGQGVAVFEAGLPAGDYSLTITGYAEGKTPAVVKYKQALKVALKTVALQLSIEGPQGTVAEGSLEASNALEALKQLTASNNIPLNITEYPFGSMVDGINGIKGGTYGGYWTFVVHRGGEWVYPDLGMDSYPLEKSDRVVVYFGGMNTQVVDSVTVASPQPKPGEKFTVAVTQKQWVYNDKTFTSDPVVTPAAGVQVTAGGQKVTTDKDGIAVFESGLPAGSYTLTVTGYAADSTPSVVRYAQQLTVASPVVVTPVADSATISVTGDSTKGVILPSANVTLNVGETAYSLLVRQLGSRVVASGSGDGLYVRSIDGLAEFDRGPESGWMYLVNGVDPKSSAGSYKLKNGDVLAWVYTTKLGADVGGLPTGSGSGTSTGTVDITSENTLPLQQVGQTTSVSNTANPMTAAAAAALSQKLAANQAAAEQEVTPGAAAVLKDSVNEVQLQLPAGSVSGTVKIRVQEISSDRSELVSGLYEFTPNGTRFLKTADLSVTIPVMTLNPANLALAWLDETSGQWIPVPSVLNAATGVITGKISHFTKYAVVDRSKWEPQQEKLKSDIAATAKAVTALGENSDWQAIGLARTGNAVPADYLNGVKEQLAASKGAFRKVTDYERLVLAVAAAGGDPRSIGGYNLIEKIYNNTAMMNQGSNGLIFALIALDSGAYNVPANAQWSKERLLKTLLDMQSKDGGFPLSAGGTDDVDITAMAVTALSSHMEQTEVKAAAEKAIAWLSQQQLENGGFKLGGVENSESTAQVIIALSTAGIGPNDSRFVKAKGGLLSHLASFRQGDGGYIHVSGEAVNGVATEQALLALAAYDRFLNGEAKLFSIAPAVSGDVTFTDERLISSWALDAVRKAYDTGLMQGVSADSLVFAPKQNITRAEFAALLLRLTGNSPSAASAAPVFSDVKADAWYYGAVLKAKELGIISGVTENRFNPNGVITRQDMAVMISRAFKLETGTAAAGALKFSDENVISSYALNAVYAVNAQGYMTGFNGAFDPSAKVTREMAAVVAVRLP